MNVTTDKRHVILSINDQEWSYKIENIPIKNQRENIFGEVATVLKNSSVIRAKLKKTFLDYEETKDEAQLYNNFLKLKASLTVYARKNKIFSTVKNMENTRRSRKKQVFFSTDEMLDILHASFYLKFYTIFYATKLRPSKETHNKIFGNLLQSLSRNGILSKLYKLIQIKVFASVPSNKPFWQYLKFVTGDSPETICIDTYVNTLENVLPMLNHDKNPITYLVVYAKGVVDFVFISKYPETFFYESMFYYDTTESNQKSGDQVLPLLTVKHILEKNITPRVNQRYNLDIAPITKIIELNPLTEIVAIPFFAKLTGTKTTLYRSLNLYYLYTISLYTAIVLSYLNFTYIPKLMACTAVRKKNKRGARITAKDLAELQGLLNPTLSGVATQKKLFQKMIHRLNNCEFIDVQNKGETIAPNENKLIEEVTEFYKMLFSGRLRFTFSKLREKNFDCYAV